MNDFAKSQLMKYGWTEGKGLGKHENGIAEALKTKLKLDKTGVGHKDKDWHNWWETAYNKAANNIKIDSQVDDVLISVQKENTSDLAEDSNKKQMKFQPLKYSNFLKTSTLLNGNLITENSTASKVEDAPSITNVSLTDEELFQICGGRTAHKGARHGLTLNGKLNRIAQQEKDLLNITTYRNTNIEKLETNNNKSESNDHEIDNNNDIVSLPIHPFTEELIVPTISKTERRKTKKRINTLTRQLNNLCNVSDNNNEKDMHNTDNGVPKKRLKVEEKEKSKKCKRKKERRGSVSGDFESIQTEETDIFPVSKKLGKKMKRKLQEQKNDYIQSNFNDGVKHKKKKKKSKKKNQDYQYECIPDTWDDEELAGSKAKKLKKSQNNDSTLQLFTKDEDIDNLECKFQTKLHCDQTSTQSNHANDLSENVSDVYFKSKIDRLNAKIKKKKNSKFLKKQERKLCADLEAVHFGTEEITEKESTKNKVEAIENVITSNIAFDKIKPSRKMKKKCNKRKALETL